MSQNFSFFSDQPADLPPEYRRTDNEGPQVLPNESHQLATSQQDRASRNPIEPVSSTDLGIVAPCPSIAASGTDRPFGFLNYWSPITHPQDNAPYQSHMQPPGQAMYPTTQPLSLPYADPYGPQLGTSQRHSIPQLFQPPTLFPVNQQICSSTLPYVDARATLSEEPQRRPNIDAYQSQTNPIARHRYEPFSPLDGSTMFSPFPNSPILPTNQQSTHLLGNFGETPPQVGVYEFSRAGKRNLTAEDINAIIHHALSDTTFPLGCSADLAASKYWATQHDARNSLPELHRAAITHSPHYPSPELRYQSTDFPSGAPMLRECSGAAPMDLPQPELAPQGNILGQQSASDTRQFYPGFTNTNREVGFSGPPPNSFDSEAALFVRRSAPGDINRGPSPGSVVSRQIGEQYATDSDIKGGQPVSYASPNDVVGKLDQALSDHVSEGFHPDNNSKCNVVISLNASANTCKQQQTRKTVDIRVRSSKRSKDTVSLADKKPERQVRRRLATQEQPKGSGPAGPLTRIGMELSSEIRSGKKHLHSVESSSGPTTFRGGAVAASSSLPVKAADSPVVALFGGESVDQLAALEDLCEARAGSALHTPPSDAARALPTERPPSSDLALGGIRSMKRQLLKQAGQDARESPLTLDTLDGCQYSATDQAIMIQAQNSPHGMALDSTQDEVAPMHTARKTSRNAAAPKLTPDAKGPVHEDETTSDRRLGRQPVSTREDSALWPLKHAQLLTTGYTQQPPRIFDIGGSLFLDSAGTLSAMRATAGQARRSRNAKAGKHARGLFVRPSGPILGSAKQLTVRSIIDGAREPDDGTQPSSSQMTVQTTIKSLYAQSECYNEPELVALFISRLPGTSSRGYSASWNAYVHGRSDLQRVSPLRSAILPMVFSFLSFVWMKLLAGIFLLVVPLLVGPLVFFFLATIFLSFCASALRSGGRILGISLKDPFHTALPFLTLCFLKVLLTNGWTHALASYLVTFSYNNLFAAPAPYSGEDARLASSYLPSAGAKETLEPHVSTEVYSSVAKTVQGIPAYMALDGLCTAYFPSLATFVWGNQSTTFQTAKKYNKQVPGDLLITYIALEHRAAGLNKLLARDALLGREAMFYEGFVQLSRYNVQHLSIYLTDGHRAEFIRLLSGERPNKGEMPWQSQAHHLASSDNPSQWLDGSLWTMDQVTTEAPSKSFSAGQGEPIAGATTSLELISGEDCPTNVNETVMDQLSRNDAFLLVSSDAIPVSSFCAKLNVSPPWNGPWSHKHQLHTRNRRIFHQAVNKTDRSVIILTDDTGRLVRFTFNGRFRVFARRPRRLNNVLVDTLLDDGLEDVLLSDKEYSQKYDFTSASRHHASYAHSSDFNEGQNAELSYGSYRMLPSSCVKANSRLWRTLRSLADSILRYLCNTYRVFLNHELSVSLTGRAKKLSNLDASTVYNELYLRNQRRKFYMNDLVIVVDSLYFLNHCEALNHNVSVMDIDITEFAESGGSFGAYKRDTYIVHKNTVRATLLHPHHTDGSAIALNPKFTVNFLFTSRWALAFREKNAKTHAYIEVSKEYLTGLSMMPLLTDRKVEVQGTKETVRQDACAFVTDDIPFSMDLIYSSDSVNGTLRSRRQNLLSALYQGIFWRLLRRRTTLTEFSKQRYRRVTDFDTFVFRDGTQYIDGLYYLPNGTSVHSRHLASICAACKASALLADDPRPCPCPMASASGITIEPLSIPQVRANETKLSMDLLSQELFKVKEEVFTDQQLCMGTQRCSADRKLWNERKLQYVTDQIALLQFKYYMAHYYHVGEDFLSAELNAAAVVLQRLFLTTRMHHAILYAVVALFAMGIISDLIQIFEVYVDHKVYYVRRFLAKLFLLVSPVVLLWRYMDKVLTIIFVSTIYKRLALALIYCIVSSRNIFNLSALVVVFLIVSIDKRALVVMYNLSLPSIYPDKCCMLRVCRLPCVVTASPLDYHIVYPLYYLYLSVCFLLIGFVFLSKRFTYCWLDYIFMRASQYEINIFRAIHRDSEDRATASKFVSKCLDFVRRDFWLRMLAEHCNFIAIKMNQRIDEALHYRTPVVTFIAQNPVVSFVFGKTTPTVKSKPFSLKAQLLSGNMGIATLVVHIRRLFTTPSVPGSSTQRMIQQSNDDPIRERPRKRVQQKRARASLVVHQPAAPLSRRLVLNVTAPWAPLIHQFSLPFLAPFFSQTAYGDVQSDIVVIPREILRMGARDVQCGCRGPCRYAPLPCRAGLPTSVSSGARAGPLLYDARPQYTLPSIRFVHDRARRLACSMCMGLGTSSFYATYSMSPPALVYPSALSTDGCLRLGRYVPASGRVSSSYNDDSSGGPPAYDPCILYSLIVGDDVYTSQGHFGGRSSRDFLVPLATTFSIEPSVVLKRPLHGGRIVSLMAHPFVNAAEPEAGDTGADRSILISNGYVAGTSLYGISLLGSVRRMLSQDQGIYMKVSSPPVGSLIRDDYIGELTQQEVAFMLAVCFLDFESSSTLLTTNGGKLQRHLYADESYVDRERAALLSDYDSLVSIILSIKPGTAAAGYREMLGYLPADVHEYELLTALGFTPVFRGSLLFDAGKLLRKHWARLTAWADKIITAAALQPESQQQDRELFFEFQNILCAEIKRASASRGGCYDLCRDVCESLANPSGHSPQMSDPAPCCIGSPLDSSSNDTTSSSTHPRSTRSQNRQDDHGKVYQIINALTLDIEVRILELTVLGHMRYALDVLNNVLYRSYGFVPLNIADPNGYNALMQSATADMRMYFHTDSVSNRDYILNHSCKLGCTTRYLDRTKAGPTMQALFTGDDSLFCRGCYGAYAHRLLIPLSRCENHLRRQHSALFRDVLSRCVCEEDIMGLLSAGGFLTPEFLYATLQRENHLQANTALGGRNQSSLKDDTNGMQKISTQACVTRIGNSATQMFRVRAVCEALLSSSLLLARLRYLSLGSADQLSMGSYAAYSSCHKTMRRSQVNYLTTLLRMSEGKRREIKLYDKSGQPVYTGSLGEQDTLPLEWDYAVCT